jgi:hypothetical protein
MSASTEAAVAPHAQLHASRTRTICTTWAGLQRTQQCTYGEHAGTLRVHLGATTRRRRPRAPSRFRQSETVGSLGPGAGISPTMQRTQTSVEPQPRRSPESGVRLGHESGSKPMNKSDCEAHSGFGFVACDVGYRPVAASVSFLVLPERPQHEQESVA